MRHLILFFSILFIFTGCAMKNRDAELNALFDRYKEYSMHESPEMATYEGDHRYDDRLTDYSNAAATAHYDSLRAFLREAQGFDSTALSPQNRQSRDLFALVLKESLEAEKFHPHYIPLTQQDGLHIGFPQLTETQPLKTLDDYRTYVKRLRAFPKAVDDIIANMRLGMKAQITAQRFSMEQVLEQIHAIADSSADRTPFFQTVERPDASLTAEEKVEVRAMLVAALDDAVLPAYRKLAAFIHDEYLSASHTEDGVWALPDGEERYRLAIRHETTTDLPPDSIFAIGMNEVARITGEMEKVKNSVGFTGTLQEFNKYIVSNDPRLVYAEKQPMMDDYRTILHKVDSALPTLFGRLPKAPYDLKEIEQYRAKSAPQAYYYPAPEDRSRPGYFYVNTYDLPSRPKFSMTALALHEAVPGHHLQIAIAQELTQLPWVRRQMGFTAFVEGWALYAERLGYEMHLYDEPFQRYGALSFDMWRACRLVVDVGLHHKRWTREQAVQFMMEHAANPELDTRSEVDRYAVWPGQALAYKIGQLKILELRAKAEKELGAKFDIRAFHDTILGEGALPLSMLEAQVNAWIEKQKK